MVMGMIKHFQGTQGNKFAMPLQYLEKEVRMKFIMDFIKDKKFYKLDY